ncbi:AGE family epimerase/isomerase [bacterium]|nr:AGE family epimerase/isomerase [bacterium]
MDRRAFLSVSAGTGAAAAGLSCGKEPVHVVPAADVIGDIDGMSLEDLRSQFRSELFDVFLPAMDKMVIDHELGGFMCNATPDGTHTNVNKRTWYEGRGIWVYSFLYNHVDKKPEYLEVARKAVEFILKTRPPDDSLWNSWFTREGKPVGGPDTVIYSDLFVATGLQEYSQASGDERYWDIAKELLLKMMHIYDSRPGFGAIPPGQDVPGGSQGGYDPNSFGSAGTNVNKPGVPRTRILGHWMLVLRLTTQMLRKRADAEVKAIADRCQDAIMNYHFNPDYRLFNEYLNYDLTRIDNDHGQVVLGHGQEGMWMVMERALDNKDRQLFDTCAERLKRQIEVFWDDVYGGELLELLHVDKNIWNTTKALWLHDEVLIGTMMVIEHTGAEWAKRWFTQTNRYIGEKLDQRQYGFPLWMCYTDRKATFNPKYDRIENFHHPRHLMLNLLALDRMIERGGKVSHHFDA